MTKVEIIAKRWRTLSIFQDMDTVPTTLAQNEILDLLDYIAELKSKIATLEQLRMDCRCDEQGMIAKYENHKQI